MTISCKMYIISNCCFSKIIALRERQSTLQDSLHRIRDHDIASQNIDERIRLEKDLIEVKERLSHYDRTVIATQSQSQMVTINSTNDRSNVFNFLSSLLSVKFESWLFSRSISVILCLLNV